MGSWGCRRNQYIQLVKVLYCKLPTIGKQLPALLQNLDWESKSEVSIVLNTRTYKTGKTADRSGDLQNRTCKLYVKVQGKITDTREQMYVKTKYQNKAIQS